MEKQRLWLCIAPTAACLCDAGVTLAGQPESYWAGRYDTALELSPMYVLCLQTHPLAFAAAIVGWIIVFSSAVLSVPRRIALGISFALVLSHSFGVCTWLLDRVAGGPWLLVAVYGVSAGLLVLTWEQAGVIRRIDGNGEPNAADVRGRHLGPLE